MDGIIALGHFCESHGPCVILCTQRCKEEPQQFPHSLTVSICDACQSLDLKQAFISKENQICYVTTRTPLQQDLSFLLRQAVVRSLSCEETSREGSTLYFGDNERGHIISHTFSVHDSLARGFQRKYCILVLTRDKIHLLNCWSFLTKHITQISKDLQDKSGKVNNLEQMHISQRAVRQAQATSGNISRSLAQLTGEPAIFAHMHLWFTWLLSTETIIEKPFKPLNLPVQCHKAQELRMLYKNMPQNIFYQVGYCYLTGTRVQTDDPDVESCFRQLLPTKFSLPKNGETCILIKTEASFKVTWNGSIPQKLPNLLLLIEDALKNENLSDAVLEPHLTSLVMQWYNIACVVCWGPNNNTDLLRSLGVQKQDMPLLSYWIVQCKD